MVLGHSFLGCTLKHNKTAVALSLVFISIFISLFLISDGTYVWGGDTGLPIYNFSIVENGLYIWSSIALAGSPMPVTSTIGVIFGVLQSIFSFDSAFVNLFSIFIWSFFGALGMFFLVRKATASLEPNISIFASSAAAIIFATPYGTIAAVAMPLPWMLLSALYIYEINEKGR